MSQGIIITLIICGTILLLGFGGMIIALYAIKKGIGWLGQTTRDNNWLGFGKTTKENNKKE
jgi:hypothetical protein